MIRIKVPAVVSGEAWSDEELFGDSGVDVAEVSARPPAPMPMPVTEKPNGLEAARLSPGSCIAAVLGSQA